MHRIPIYCPVPLSATTTQQAAPVEVHLNDGATATIAPTCIGGRKRKLNEYGGEADSRRTKRPNLHMQTAVDHEFLLPQQLGTTSELSKICDEIEDDLRAALIENEKMNVQICELEAIHGQIADCLRDLKDKMDKFAEDI
ncbi:hypothetical protein EDB85DRAFT_2165217 [Lactarius pseudohatsudake]|nr:hypothetical protein EDB85DRAFT_2165217 [Lactarius pseudohatsudake]